MMCPGLTSEGGLLDESAEVGDVVALMAEGKKHALGVGVLKMSPKDIWEINKEMAVEVVMFLTDGLWDSTVD